MGKKATLPLLLVPLLLGGCAEIACRGGPLQQELSQLESEYGEVSANLARGYAVHVQYVEEQEPYTELGAGGEERTRYRTVQRRVETPVAIDVDDQQRRADYLRRSIDRLAGPAESEYYECRAARG